MKKPSLLSLPFVPKLTVTAIFAAGCLLSCPAATVFLWNVPSPGGANNWNVIGNQGSAGLNSGTIFDLSGLSNFVYNASAGAVQMGVSNRSTANLTLAAASNSITAATINVDTGSSSSSGTAGALKFGAGTN